MHSQANTAQQVQLQEQLAQQLQWTPLLAHTPPQQQPSATGAHICVLFAAAQTAGYRHWLWLPSAGSLHAATHCTHVYCIGSHQQCFWGSLEQGGRG